jgi:hypothetical protein
MIMSENGMSNTVYHMKTLCVKSDTSSYDILGYKYVYIVFITAQFLENETTVQNRLVYINPILVIGSWTPIAADMAILFTTFLDHLNSAGSPSVRLSS